jgi:hypothetical protein
MSGKRGVGFGTKPSQVNSKIAIMCNLASFFDDFWRTHPFRKAFLLQIPSNVPFSTPEPHRRST